MEENVSFGTLLKRQEKLSRKRKREDAPSNPDTDANPARLDALKARFKHLGKDKPAAIPKLTQEDDSNASASDIDSAPSEADDDAPTTTSHSRTSKHAPAVQSSKHPVTRKRQVVHLPKPPPGDPRFNAAIMQHSGHTGTNLDKAYAFLRDYQRDEISELRAALHKARTDEHRETLRREMNMRENSLKAHASREREKEVVARHRREEKAAVAEGKKPFFLKRKEVKEQALVEKFRGMKGKEREKAMDRRRKREGQREKKRMPNARRVEG